jgi:hypothetical protein
MTERFHSLRHGFEHELKQNLNERNKEAERITALLRDVRTPHAGASMDLLARHARGWLLVAYSAESGFVSHLVPVVEAWIEHGFPLSQGAHLRKTLLVNVRLEQGGVHFSVRSEISNIPDDVIGWSETSWHTFMKGEGVELDIAGRRMSFSYHASEAEAIENSGINMTQHDEPRTPYNYEDILTRLSRHCTMTRIQNTQIRR